MQSLRSGRSSKQPQRAPTKLSKGSVPNRKPTTSRSVNSRVDDKIKKRMSMRYADISGPTELNIPDVPSIPMEHMAAHGMRRMVSEQDERLADEEDTTAREDPIVADKRLLDQENFDPDAFLKLKLANSTEAELKMLQSSLRVVQDETARELQHDVFKNYEEFVAISKEISTLENEMLELKESLNEWKSMPSSLHVDHNASVVDRKRAARSSIADLRVLYANQMQALHSQIEGSTKFAPTISGRHVIAEVAGVSNLNAATYKVEHVVKFVILDDLILVARKKRRPGGASGQSGEGKWVAERCWPLNEMLVLDTKDSASMTNVFKIKHNKETFVYRTDSSGEKKSLLAQFRSVADDLGEKKRKEREGEHERRRTMLNRATQFVDAGSNLSGQDWINDLARRAGIDEDSNAKTKAENDNRWTNEWADELTVAIALKEWGKGVALVEQGKIKLPVTPPLANKLGPLMTNLITALLVALSHPSVRKPTATRLISYLERLGAGSAARTTFLSMREQVIKSHIRRIKFTGDIAAYIGDLAIVVFTGIKHTADWFLSSFKENPVTSSFVEWAKDQIEIFASIFRTQVYTSGVSPDIVSECLKVTHARSQKHLQDFGLDFRFLLDKLLKETPDEPKAESVPKLPPRRELRKNIPDESRSEPVPQLPPRRGPVAAPPTIISPALPSRHRSPAPPSPSARVGTPPVAATYQAPSPLKAPIPLPASRRPSISNNSSLQDPNLLSSRLSSRTPVNSTPSVPSAPPTPSRQRARTPNNAPPTAGIAQLSKVELSQSRIGTRSPGPPPRSVHRPQSSVSYKPPTPAVPQHEGML